MPQGVAFLGVGQAFGGASKLAKVVAHATTGGIISDLQGGKFGHGFFSAGITKGVQVNNLVPSDIYGGAIASAVVGGTTSAITGGKFTNGATTGAFQFVMNAWLSGAIASDKHGEKIVDHWLEGTGESLVLSDDEWARYMQANQNVRRKILESLKTDAATRTESGEFTIQTNVGLKLLNSSTASDYTSGYGVLNGSNSRVGGFIIGGTATVNSNGSVSFNYSAIFNDIVAPNLNYGMDRFLYGVIDNLTTYTPQNYNIHIQWQGQQTIKPPLRY
jgi:hypothetical protein